MNKEEIESCKKSVKYLLDNYCKGCKDNFGSCLDCLDEQEYLEEDTIWVIDKLQQENEKQKKILDILKPHLRMVQDTNGLVGLEYDMSALNTKEQQLIKEWLGND